jgi:hypothetical protein
MGKKHNDYGYGFYCTSHREMAMEWAVSGNKCGYANSYEIDTRGLTVFKLNDYPILIWLTVLIENRLFQLTSPLAREAYRYLTKEFHVDYRKYDIITGYRADDSYFSFAQDFLNGTISVSQLSRAMKLGNLGEQIVIRSKKAFERLVYLDSYEADNLIWYPKRKERDDKAREDYFNTDRMNYIKGDIYITRILDEEMKPSDERLQ